ncbi:phosphohistidine phosphatase SixA [Oceanobacter mangrovi]|uniref:phosphohistidine phosphatase SixA n=1 Tax=Oceanobacter mangrovi TaxID=2862510 RepID=UPI001C8D5FCA
MKICVVRHGSAMAGQLDDVSRGLTESGLREVVMAGKWLASQQWNNPVIWASPYHRAQQTAAAISEASGLDVDTHPTLVPSADVQPILDDLVQQQRDLILVSHLPLVGRLAATLIDGQAYDQPWSPAECWVLEGDIAAAGCMSVAAVWYPALER